MQTTTIEIPSALATYMEGLAVAIDVRLDLFAAILLVRQLASCSPVNANDPTTAFRGSSEALSILKQVGQLEREELPSWLPSLHGPDDALK